MSFSRGDVVLVDYPFSDRTGSKVRLIIAKIGEPSAPLLQQVSVCLKTALDLP